MKKDSNIGDLLKDKSLRNWWKQSNKSDMDKWEKWGNESADQKETLENIKGMFGGFKFKKSNISDAQTNESWNSFASKLQEEEATNQRQRRIPIQRSTLRIAASIAFLVLAFFAYQQFNTSNTILASTLANETTTVQLPDGSIVHLNNNSSLEYSSDFENQKTRKVILKGEGYFEIEKQSQGTTFQVIANETKINVIGTKFNVNTKRPSTIIALNEGKITVKHKNLSQDLEAGQTLISDEKNQQFKIVVREATYWSSWVQQEWAFGQGISMSEVIQRIEETFHVTCQVENPSLLNILASGDVSIESKEVLFEALSILLDLEIIEENQKVIIRKR